MFKHSVRNPILSPIDERISAAVDSRDMVLLTQVRGEIARQNEESSDREHARWVERTKMWWRIAGSFMAIAVGTGLLIGGFNYAGIFALGGGLFGFFPEYIKVLARSYKKIDRSYDGDD